VIPRTWWQLPKAHWLITWFVAFAVGFAALIIVVLPGIFLQWPIAVVQIAYFLMLSASIVRLLYLYRAKLRLPDLHQGWSRHLTTTALLVIPVVVIVAAGYAYTLHNGTESQGDAKFELAQITLFAEKHLTLTDPIFGKAGVPPTGYSTSIQHAAQAAAAGLLHQSAAWVWFYSGAFFQLLLWIALFALSWEFLPKPYRREWSYALLALIPLFDYRFFAYPELHNMVVYIWTALFILAVKLWVEHKTPLLLYVAAILLGSTHPLNASMAALFLGLVAVALLSLRLMQLRRLFPLIPVFVLLGLPMVLYYHYPHGITAAGFNDNGATYATALALKKVGPLYVNVRHVSIALGQIIISGLLLGILILSKQISRNWLRTIVGILVCAGLVLALPFYTYGLIGLWLLFRGAITRGSRIVILLLLSFSALVVYNPLVLTVFHGVLPQWTVARFQEFNLLVYIGTLIGLLGVLILPFNYLGTLKSSRIALPLALVMAIFVVPWVVPQMQPINFFDSSPRQSKQYELQFYETLASLYPSLQSQRVISDDQDTLSFLPAAIQANVFSISNEANASPSVHIQLRKQCVKSMISSLTIQKLSASGATRLLVTPQSSQQFRTAVQNLPVLSLQQSSHGYQTYAIRQNRDSASAGVCHIPGNTY